MRIPFRCAFVSISYWWGWNRSVEIVWVAFVLINMVYHWCYVVPSRTSRDINQRLGEITPLNDHWKSLWTNWDRIKWTRWGCNTDSSVLWFLETYYVFFVTRKKHTPRVTRRVTPSLTLWVNDIEKLFFFVQYIRSRNNSLYEINPFINIVMWIFSIIISRSYILSKNEKKWFTIPKS